MTNDDYAVSIVELPEQPTVIIRRRVKPMAIGTALAEILPTTFGYATTHGHTIAGAPFLRYERMAAKEFDIAAGVVLAAPVTVSPSDAKSPAGTLEAMTLPGGPTATCLYLGEYGGVGTAWDALIAFARATNPNLPPGPMGGWDSYTNDPTEVAPEAVETTLFLPLQV